MVFERCIQWGHGRVKEFVKRVGPIWELLWDFDWTQNQLGFSHSLSIKL